MVNQTVIKLMDLAEHKTDQSRQQLFENITDLFLSDEGRLNDHERALMSDILLRLVKTVELDIRGELAQFFVDSDVNMPDLVNYLVNDEIEIARPILERGKVLHDEQLIQVIRMRTDEHRMAIALRENLSADVSDALVEYGNVDVIETLLKNPDALLSDRALEYTVAESRRIDRFQEPLLQRGDLPPELAYRMYWWVSAALRKEILSRFDLPEIALDDGMQQATHRAIVDQQEGEGAVVRAQRLVRRMAEMRELTPEFMVQSLRQGKLVVFVAGLADRAAIDFKTAWRVFTDKGGESLAVLIRAIDIDRNTYSTMQLLVDKTSRGTAPRPAGDLNRMLEIFDGVDPSQARNVLRYWQRDAAYQSAIDELKNAG